MRRLITGAALAAVALIALLGTAADGGQKAKKTYRIVLDNGFGLVEGGDLKIGGVKAGQTSSFELSDGEPKRVVVTAEVTEPGFDSLRTDARCDVRQQSLIGEYFVDCDLGKADEELPDGGTVPVSRTSSTIPPDLINNIMRRPYRERFRLLISELGVGLAGRPQELNEVIRRAHPALRETSQTFNILARQNRVIRDFIRDADTVSEAVEPFKEDVARWAREASKTASIQSSRSEELGRYWNRLPAFLGELEPTMAELGQTADAQIPALTQLRRAAPTLTRFLTQIEPFARSSRNSIDDLGRSLTTGREAIRQSKQEIKELRALSVNAPRLGKPLRQFLQSIDDRGRSTEADPLAKQTAPPAPDKTAYKAGQGFTGMEGLFNYIYYQTLGVNAFDDLGHLLRIVAFTAGDCSGYSAKPTKELSDKCSSWLGPYQPGVNRPDPTETSVAAREKAERKSSTPQERARRRAAGEPEAPPTPGKRDPSKPGIVLPPEVQNLLDGLRGRLPGITPPRLPGRGGGRANPNDLLDYLLRP